jgi:hypothetical protein
MRYGKVPTTERSATAYVQPTDGARFATLVEQVDSILPVSLAFALGG